LHAWLFFEYAVPVELHGHGDQLLLAKEDPYRSYEMEEYGQTRVGPAQPPDVLSGFIGARPTDGAVITGHDGSAVCAGLVLRFEHSDLVIGTVGDEWVLADTVPHAPAHHWVVQPFLRGGRR
jgi:hypothetical protein